jgi:hypothetical protein
VFGTSEASTGGGDLTYLHRDTVSSVVCLEKIVIRNQNDDEDKQGSLIPRHLPHTSSNSIVKTFRHAIALDERRSKFNVNVWAKPVVEEDKVSVKAVRRQKTWYEMDLLREDKYGRSETDVLEVWFAGTHAGPSFFQRK